MRFMLLVYPDAESTGPTLERVKAMNRFNEELSRAGVLLALDGLHPPSEGTRLRFSGDGRPAVTDGPFTEAKEFVGGYWVIQARTHEEAVEWASRAPLGPGTIEVRRLAEAADFGPEIEAATALSKPPREQPSVSD